jgi:hypothetical protein
MRLKKSSGVTFIEIVVSIGIVLVLVLILATSLNTVKLARTVGYQSQAYRIASEELETIKNLSAGELTNRTNSDFINVFYNQGSWIASADATAPSSPNVLTLSTTSPVASTALSAALVLPGDGGYGDFDLDSRIKILAPAPTSTKSGLIFRAKDAQNYYRLALENSALRMEKVQNGMVTSLWSSVQTFASSTWYQVKVTATGANFDIYLAGTKLTTVTDTNFSSGKIGFFTANNTKISVDDVAVTAGGMTTNWNFDTSPAGTTPKDLVRFGLYDLPSGTAYLTIANQIVGVDTLKKITVRITWIEEGGTKTVQLETLKNL